MEFGLLYFVFDKIIKLFCRLNLVEWFKHLGSLIDKKNSKKNSEEFAYRDTAVDLFIILKWLAIVFFWYYQISNDVVCVITWYLIVTNVFTYFYYHIWHESSMFTEAYKIDRVRRRFAFLIYAISFSLFSFAYLYAVPYRYEFKWINPSGIMNSFLFSISNSFAYNYEGVLPETQFAWTVSTIQFIITVIFLSIILTKSIPQTQSKEKNNGLQK